MIFLSQLINKNVYYQQTLWGKVKDIAVVEKDQYPLLSKLIIEHQGDRVTVSPQHVQIKDDGIYIRKENLLITVTNEKEIFLHEDLLDKQVIDVDGKRLVRVNDVLLEFSESMQVVGIDISVSALLRRLGLHVFAAQKTKILPWNIIETFDYQTGTVRVKVAHSKLNAFHPADLADILEEVGTKERLGIVNVLDTEKAAQALEEADEQTQEAILEQLPPSPLKKIVNSMPLSEIADVFYKINPIRIKQIIKLLGKEKAEEVEKLLRFPENTAGGLMDPTYITARTTDTIATFQKMITGQEEKPEAVILLTREGRAYGILQTKDVFGDEEKILKTLPVERRYISSEARFSEVLQLFTQYNLRLIPVIDKNRRPLGVISIDVILGKLEEQKERDDAI